MIEIAEEQMFNNIVIMVLTQKDNSSFQIYYWDESDREKCKPTKSYPKFFNCRFGNITAFDIHEENVTSMPCVLKVKAIAWPPFVIFPRHLQKTLQNKPVDKILLNGIEIELMNVISKYLRIKVEYYVSYKEDWGTSYFNGSSTNTMNDLMTKKVDIAIGSFSVSNPRVALFRMSQSYAEEHMLICVPNRSYIKFWSNFFNISSLKLFLSVFIIRGMGIYSSPDNLRYFDRKERLWFEKQILKNWIDCHNVTRCLEDVYANHEKAICMDENYKNYILHNSKKVGESTLHCLKRKLTSNPIGMIMRKTLPMLEEIDNIIGKIIAADDTNITASLDECNELKQEIETNRKDL
ncbi:hypothetical protein HHI36_024092 [Cryptolaemus montrouzieri]|uniref:Ionotropic glutamate receptor L-glutamate and glycine-binding domain-containing protein n=1 Tax=Cryptolaemus montrouzieri TaxID=559131 RepID=A0ABD2N1E7_9CUCU